MAHQSHLHLRLLSVNVAGDIATVIYAVGEPPASEDVVFTADLSNECLWGFAINDNWDETKRVAAFLPIDPVEFWGTMMPILDAALESHFIVTKSSNVIPIRGKKESK